MIHSMKSSWVELQCTHGMYLQDNWKLNKICFPKLSVYCFGAYLNKEAKDV